MTQAASCRGPMAPRYPEPMAATETAETLGLRPFHEFDEAHATWPRGDRPEAIRAAAADFRKRFKTRGQVRAVRTVDLVSAGYPTRYAFGGAARGSVNPVRQHRQPPRGRAVRGLRRRAEDARLGAHDARGLERGAVLRPADRALRRAGRAPALDRVPHLDLGARAARPRTGRRRLRVLRPPARAGPPAPDGDDDPGRRRERAARAVLSQRDVRAPAAGRSTRSRRSTRRSGRGTCPAAWTA